MHNRTLNSSKLNKTNLNRTKNTSVIQEEPDSIIAAWNEIDIIKRENKLLKDEIDTETRVVKSNQTQQVIRLPKEEQSLLQIERIQDESSQLASLIELESKKNRDLSLLLTVEKEEISENKKYLSKADGNALPQIQSKIKSQEYQLEKIRGRQNESQAQINMLKEQLNMVRRERVIFSNVFKKLEQDIKKKDDEFKKYILERMKEEQKKKKAEEQFAKTKAWANQEIKKKQDKYEEALMEIEEDIEQEKNRIVEQKHQRIFETEVIEQQSQIVNKSKITDYQQGASPKKVNNNSSLLLKQSQTNNLEITEEEVEYYNFLFKKLKRETGVDTIDEFIEKFKSINEQNDELYNQCNQRSDTIVDLQKQISEIDTKTNRLQNGGDDEQVNKSDGQDKKNVSQDKHNKIKTSVKRVNAQNKRMVKDITRVNQSIEQIAKLIKVPLPEEGLTEKNANKFISLIEQKISDIINMSEFCNEEVKNIERQPKVKNTQDKDKDINECLDTIEKNKEAERIKSRRDLEEVAFEAIRDFNKKRKVKN